MPVLVDVATFKRQFPEFAHAAPDLVAVKLADAGAMVDAAALGDRYDEFTKYMAAELLGATPSGEFARLKKPDDDGSLTLYGRRARAITRTVFGAMVL